MEIGVPEFEIEVSPEKEPVPTREPAEKPIEVEEPVHVPA